MEREKEENYTEERKKRERKTEISKERKISESGEKGEWNEA